MPKSMPETPQQPTNIIHMINVEDKGFDTLASYAPKAAMAVLNGVRDSRGKMALALDERLSRRWLKNSLYQHEVENIHSLLNQPGLWDLNFSRHWCCTTAVDNNMTLYRTLDWPIDGMGENTVVAKKEGYAGNYYNITWPGFVGVATAIAPLRFAAALNQAPALHRWWLGKVWRLLRYTFNKGQPPMHLLRKVFEEAANFDEALDMLQSMPVKVPVIFTLVGMKPGEAAVIERVPAKAHIQRGEPLAAANHWQGPWKGVPRGETSYQRQQTLQKNMGQKNLGWAKAPVHNDGTRQVCELNVKQGFLKVKGVEANDKETDILDLTF